MIAIHPYLIIISAYVEGRTIEENEEKTRELEQLIRDNPDVFTAFEPVNDCYGGIEERGFAIYTYNPPAIGRLKEIAAHYEQESILVRHPDHHCQLIMANHPTIDTVELGQWTEVTEMEAKKAGNYTVVTRSLKQRYFTTVRIPKL